MMLLITKATVPVFFIVTFFAGLTVPSAWVANVRLVAERLTTGNPWPVPLRNTVCGLALALSLRSSVPKRVPTPVGLKLTLMVQLAAGAIRLEQLLPCV